MNSAAEAFSGLRSALEAAGGRYAVGGSWASAAFGEHRLTNDVDIVADFSPASLDRFLDSKASKLLESGANRATPLNSWPANFLSIALYRPDANGWSGHAPLTSDGNMAGLLTPTVIARST